MMTAKRKKRLLWSLAIVLLAGLLYGVNVLFQPEPGPIRITISKETTYILGPVNADGTVNYMAYLNAKHSKGVTKENNAAIPMIEIFGPEFLAKDTSGKIYKILKIEPPAEGKTYFTDLSAYVVETLSKEDKSAFWKKDSELPAHEIKSWTAEQYPVVAGWLKVNNDAMDAMLVAMQRPRYYIPLVSCNADECIVTRVMPSLYPTIGIARSLTARAMLKLESGDMTGAWADLMATRHLARRIASGYGTIDNQLGISIEENARTAIRIMAGGGKLTGPQARAFLADMQHMEPMPDLVDRIDEDERFMILDAVMLMARGTHQEGLEKSLEGILPGELKLRSNQNSLDWDKMLMMMNPWYDSIVAAAHQKTFKNRKAALDAYDRRLDEFLAKFDESRSILTSAWSYFRDPTEAIGNVLFGIFILDFRSRIIKQDRTTAEGDLTLVAMALAAYRTEKKGYPEKLAELAPGYLKKVPDDLFSDKPFGYKRTDKGYLLYSVGENMKYDGVKNSYKNDDIVVEVK
jgi:hypothetical protein